MNSVCEEFITTFPSIFERKDGVISFKVKKIKVIDDFKQRMMFYKHYVDIVKYCNPSLNDVYSVSKMYTDAINIDIPDFEKANEREKVKQISNALIDSFDSSLVDYSIIKPLISKCSFNKLQKLDLSNEDLAIEAINVIFNRCGKYETDDEINLALLNITNHPLTKKINDYLLKSFKSMNGDVIFNICRNSFHFVDDWMNKMKTTQKHDCVKTIFADAIRNNNINKTNFKEFWNKYGEFVDEKDIDELACIWIDLKQNSSLPMELIPPPGHNDKLIKWCKDNDVKVASIDKYLRHYLYSRKYNTSIDEKTIGLFAYLSKDSRIKFFFAKNDGSVKNSAILKLSFPLPFDDLMNFVIFDLSYDDICEINKLTNDEISELFDSSRPSFTQPFALSIKTNESGNLVMKPADFVDFIKTSVEIKFDCETNEKFVII